MRLPFSVPLLGALALSTPVAVFAQSTDGYHATQVIPVVVDNGSFKSRITFSNPLGGAIPVRVVYVPARGTSQQGVLDCGTFTLPIAGSVAFPSVRSLCPALPAGTQFGMLQTHVELPPDVSTNATFSYGVYSRADNPQGIGFSVEGFPAHTLTRAGSLVPGLRRLAATASAPAYQSNCFVGILPDIVPGGASNATTSVDYELTNPTGQIIGSGAIDIGPGEFVRVLDIFAHGNAPAGDHDNVEAGFYPDGASSMAAFCTVQDNTSFSADFRIAKQFLGFSALEAGSTSIFAHDEHMLRRSRINFGVNLSNGPGESKPTPFVLSATGTGNTHVIQIRHPDWFACQVLNQFQTSTPFDGFEIRLMASDGLSVIAGGNDVRFFNPVYMGDKHDRNAGSSTRYTIEVESDEVNGDRPLSYYLFCRSGSGHSVPELVRTGGPNQF
jgi:hypothetical protein